MKESFEYNYGVSPGVEKRRELEAEGWQFADNVATHMMLLDQNTLDQKWREVKKVENIQKEYLEKYKEQGLNQINLVRPHKPSDIGWTEDEHSYDVYMKKLSENE